IDPTTIISLFFEKPLEIRRSIIDLDRIVKKLGCTSILVCEIPEGSKGISAFGVEEFVADGIIVMHCYETETFTRALSIRKMRATKHDIGVHPIEITRDGVVVYPTKRVVYREPKF
ncbi:MAG TPA: ATPase domain-containing protein, partial [archaeon]|nr:ATPase domain-containing protein [archaeon]